MSAFAVVDKIARGEVYRPSRDVSRGADDSLRWPRSTRTSKLGTRADFEAAARNAADIKRPRSRCAPISKATCSPRPTRCAATRRPPRLSSRWWRSSRRPSRPEMRDAAKALGLSVREAVTLASLVEKETAVAGRTPAGGGGLPQSQDGSACPCRPIPTVIFALQRAGRYDGNLRRDDLQFDSPYNTYRYPGLPPGPIAAPGKASLEAAAAPAEGGLPVLRQQERRLTRLRARR